MQTEIQSHEIPRNGIVKHHFAPLSSHDGGGGGFHREGGRGPFLMGYRKFFIACIWLGLAWFAAIMVFGGLAPKRTDVTTLAIWIVGGAGFFSAVFVGGNAVEYWVRFWRVDTSASLQQHDRRRESYSEQHKTYSYREERSPHAEMQGVSDDSS